jgi:hypothetical protein
MELENYLQTIKLKIMSQKTSSPKGGKRGCLCKDGTYNSECCKGELSEQGIGATVSQSNCVVKDSAGNIISTRTN